MKVLLVYATREGQTAKVGRRIAEVLEESGAAVTMVDARDRSGAVDPGEFDLLVFGASIHIGKLERQLLRFVARHAAAIAAKPRALFVVLLAAATRDPNRRAQSLAEVGRQIAATLEVAFDDVEYIAGALKYSRYGWITRWLMRRIARSEGGDTDTSRDYEYTDWQQVEAYARRLPALVR